MSYSATISRTFIGREGPGYNGALHRDGRKVADLIDDASGGPVMIYYCGDAAAQRTALEAAAIAAGAGTTLGPGFAVECYVNDLVEDALQRRELRTKLRNRVLLARPDGRIVALVKTRPTPAVLAQVAASPKFAGHQCLNSLDFEDALRLWKATAQ